MNDESRFDIRAEWWAHDDDRAQRFGYRIVSTANGRTLATPGESYTKKAPMIAMIRKLFGNLVIRKVDAPGASIAVRNTGSGVAFVMGRAVRGKEV